MQDHAEVEIEMNVSDDHKIVTLKIVSTDEMDTHDLVMALESYLTDLIRAANQKDVPDVGIH